ncbi:DUF2786 domain-containing protein [Erwinia billingiae]|uniref:DUF2786 domain-containing protein n=1 Tax=Erwinia billingiae TaxID=182337 RepID=UPI001244060B|nr:DUF2786 domain-containing protein [Erwinia billingiae]QEW31987.1 DUF2786 domain-containing protein [Erwinia billingiae]
MSGLNETSRKKYLAKIQKLMRLAGNTSSPEEAASAISKAQAFMREHGISDTEVTFSEISTSSSKGAPSDAEKIPKYMSYLCSTIEKAFGVKCLLTWRWTNYSRRPKRVVSFYGQDGRDVVAAYAFDVLTRQLRTARREFQKAYCTHYVRSVSISLADNYCEGWVSGAWHAVQEMVITEAQSEQMEAYTERKSMSAARTRDARECRGKDIALQAGFRDGEKTKIYHGVDTTHKESVQIELGSRNSNG